MKRSYFLVLFCVGLGYLQAQQTTKAIFTSGTYTQIGDFNPAIGSSSNLRTVEAVESIPRDFIFDAKNGRAIYQDKNNGLVFCSISNNQITTKRFDLHTTVMAPAYMPSTEKVICFTVQREFNGYGSNEENLFFSSIDVTRGVTENLLKLSDLSFDNVAAPFYGKISVTDRFTQKEIVKDVAISKPVFIAEKNLYMVMARDVTGTNRLYKINVSSPKAAALVSTRCDYNILDMVPIIGTDYLKILFFTKTGNNYELKVGDMNMVTNSVSNVISVSTFTDTKIDNGSIQYTTDQSNLFVTRYDGSKTIIYSIDPLSNQINSTTPYSGYVQFDFGFNDIYYKTQTLNDLIGFYPNPSTGMLNFKNNTGIPVSSLKIYDNVGQVVRSIKVEDLTTEFQFDMFDMANGIYYVKVEMIGDDYFGKIAITH